MKDAPETRDTDENGGRFVRAKKHTREALSEAGLLVNTVDKASYDPGDYGKWEVVENNSIEVPEDSLCSCFQVEWKSSA